VVGATGPYSAKRLFCTLNVFQMSIDPELALKTFDKLTDMEKAFYPPHS